MTQLFLKMNMNKFLVATFLFSSANVLAEIRPEYNVTVLHDSKYISEGRNNLEDGGLNSIEFTSGWENMSAGLWYANATDASYNELNMFIEYAVNIRNLDVYAAFTRLEFPNDDEHDNEISAGFTTTIYDSSEFAIDYVYSTEAEGGFLDLTFAFELPVRIEQLSLNAYVTQSFDYGYASENFDGENNLQLGMEGSWKLNDTLSLVGLIAHSWAQKDVKRDNIGDEGWISIGLSTDF